jgi:hypothetical protein
LLNRALRRADAGPVDGSLRRVATGLCLGAALLAAVAMWRASAHADAAVTRFGTPVREITPAIRAAGLRFAPDFKESDRAWVLAAIANARPEAQQLIGEVDGLVEIGAASNLGAFGEDGRAIGLTKPGPNGFEIDLDVAWLDGDARFSRDVVVLHELGHVIDFSLIPQDLASRLDSTIPSSGPCISETQVSGGCTALEERFADTFAKWALRGAVSAAGAGYGIRAPLLDDWGQPLAILANQAGV